MSESPITPPTEPPPLTDFEKAYVVRMLEALDHNFHHHGSGVVDHRTMNQIFAELQQLKQESPEKLAQIAQHYLPGQENLLFGEEIQ